MPGECGQDGLISEHDTPPWGEGAGGGHTDAARSSWFWLPCVLSVPINPTASGWVAGLDVPRPCMAFTEKN